MPVARYTLSGAARGLRAFLNLEAGVVRSSGELAPPSPRGVEKDEQGREIEHLHRLVSAKDQELAGLRAEIEAIHTSAVRPENMIWIFGTGRSGNTWLSDLMEAMGHAVWREPSVGRLFGDFYYLRSQPGQLGTGNYILGEKQRATWLRAIRNFVLDSAGGRFPELDDGLLVVKEQVGTIGAPLLVEALPESRVILLVRDPRDGAASALNGTREGGWRHDRAERRKAVLATQEPTKYVEEWAHHYLQAMSKGREAYDEHRGPKVVVRYEDLVADTFGEIRRLRSVLSLPIGDEKLARAVEKCSWENIPAENKGEGKFRRKARAGGWREDLSPEQATVVEEVTASLLKEFYS